MAGPVPSRDAGWRRLVRGRAPPGLSPEPLTPLSVLPHVASRCSIIKQRKTSWHVGRGWEASAGLSPRGRPRPRDTACPSRGRSARSGASPGPAPYATRQPGSPVRGPQELCPDLTRVPSPAEGRLFPAPAPPGLQAGLGLRRPQTPAHSTCRGTNGPPLWGPMQTGWLILENPLTRSLCVLPASTECPTFFQSTKPAWHVYSGKPFRPSRGLTYKSILTFQQQLLKANGFDFVLKSG